MWMCMYMESFGIISGSAWMKLLSVSPPWPQSVGVTLTQLQSGRAQVAINVTGFVWWRLPRWTIYDARLFPSDVHSLLSPIYSFLTHNKQCKIIQSRPSANFTCTLTNDTIKRSVLKSHTDVQMRELTMDNSVLAAFWFSVWAKYIPGHISSSWKSSKKTMTFITG